MPRKNAHSTEKTDKGARFLDGISLRPVTLPTGVPFAVVGLALGQGTSPLELLVTTTAGQPNATTLRSAWKARHSGRAAPLLLVVLHADRASLCGPAGDDPPAYLGLDRGQVERICREALDHSDRHAARRALRDVLPSLESDMAGLRNEGFLATHELRAGARQRADWASAGSRARSAIAKRGSDLLSALGFGIEPCDRVTSILRAGDRKIAVAVLLTRDESPELSGERFSGLSPITYALTVADRENLDWVVVQHGPKVRVYPARVGVGVGRRGRTETFVECADLSLLRELAADATRVRPEDDPKLAALAEELAAIAEQAAGESVDDEDACQKRKVLVFSHYEDTIDWVEKQLRMRIAEDPRLAVYRSRVASVSGAEVRGGVTREKALHGFAPVSTGALPSESADSFDLLLCTDVLAEGMNLQQCRNVVNYDLPWNPMRLVQRHGRVDRIGSPHPRVFLRTFFPDAQLDALLNLEGRVRRKLAQAAASVGVEETPIERGATGEQSFAETREEIAKLYRSDASIYETGGTVGAAQTGEEYRQELRRALARHGDAIRDLPWRAGSGMRKGERAGHVFCATVGERVYLRFVPRESDGEIIGELGTCLRLLECTEETRRVLGAETAHVAYNAWTRAQRSIFDAWTFETDPANLQPKIRRLNRDVAAFLRDNPPANVEKERLHRCLDAIESPWPRREENLLRLAWERSFPTSIEKARHLVEEAERIGAEPFRSPNPLPPIQQDEIRLITWMAIERDYD